LAIGRTACLVLGPFERGKISQVGKLRRRRMGGEKSAERVAVDVEVSARRGMLGDERVDGSVEERRAGKPFHARKSRWGRFSVVGETRAPVNRHPFGGAVGRNRRERGHGIAAGEQRRRELALQFTQRRHRAYPLSPALSPPLHAT